MNRFVVLLADVQDRTVTLCHDLLKGQVTNEKQG